ncbi:MAG: sulfurtransferase [Chloroflexi bacterium]|nr:sulfurtransferase [Chloroflexota bacterium]
MAHPVMVSVAWLQEHLNDANVRIIDARVSDPRLPIGYRISHIPGAVPFDLNHDLYEMAPGGPHMKTPDAIAKILGARGIANDSIIVLYDEGAGPLAGTVYWLLKYLGHADVRVVNGGWHAWTQAHAPTTRDIPQITPATYTAQVDENQHSTCEWIQENSGRADLLLLDTRTDSEYYMGHIPGAVNLSFDEAIDFASQALKDTTTLCAQFERVGATPDKEIVVYCGSGSRSAHTFMVLQDLGYPRVRNYKGSIMDWADHHGLPLE